jgi:hypothetical protein
MLGAMSGACLVFNGKVATELDSDASDGASEAADTEAGTPEPGILCWPPGGPPAYCPFGYACCLDYGSTGWFGPPGDACEPDASCAGNGFVPFTCDSPFDCRDSGLTDAVCCAAPNSGSSCLPWITCQGIGVALCNPQDAVPCPQGLTCGKPQDAGAAPPGYSVCE